MTEQTFKLVLNSLWRCFASAVELENKLKHMHTLPSVRMESESYVQMVNHSKDIQAEIASVIELLGADPSAIVLQLGMDMNKTRRVTLHEQFMDYLYTICAIYPESLQSESFPENCYSSLLKLFTDAGFALPFEKVVKLHE